MNKVIVSKNSPISKVLNQHFFQAPEHCALLATEFPMDENVDTLFWVSTTGLSQYWALAAAPLRLSSAAP